MTSGTCLDAADNRVDANVAVVGRLFQRHGRRDGAVWRGEAGQPDLGNLTLSISEAAPFGLNR